MKTAPQTAAFPLPDGQVIVIEFFCTEEQIQNKPELPHLHYSFFDAAKGVQVVGNEAVNRKLLTNKKLLLQTVQEVLSEYYMN